MRNTQQSLSAALVLIGNELTEGRISDKHSAWLAQSLQPLGISFGEMVLIPDSRPLYLQTVRRLMMRYPLLISCGGLGATHDDLTQSVLSEIMDIDLSQPNAHGAQRVHALPNDVGVAEGIVITHAHGHVIALPGPIQELRAMVNNHLLAYARDHLAHKRQAQLVLSVFNVNELQLETVARSVLSVPPYSDIRWGTRITDWKIELMLYGQRRKTLLQSALLLRKEIGRALLYYGDIELHAVVMARLQRKQHVLVTYESSTAGLISARIAQQPGASAILWGGFVAYQQSAKRTLHVASDIIKRHGTVSPQTAQAMATAALRGAQQHATIALAITGVAGPDSSESGIAVGTAYSAIVDRSGGSAVHTIALPNPSRATQINDAHARHGQRAHYRQRMQRKFATQALLFLIDYLK